MQTILLSDPRVLRDPLAAYGQAREKGPVARLEMPGLPSMWAITRHERARAMLADPRFQLSEATFMQRPAVPEHCRKHMRTMQEMEGTEHSRLRRLASPAFTARRAEAFRPRVRALVDALLDDLDGGEGQIDLVTAFARPLPIDVIAELVGIPEADRPAWRGYGIAVAAGHGQAFADAIPAIIRDAAAAVELRSREPADDILSALIGSPLSPDELVTMVWQLVLGGQTPVNLIANAVEALLSHPDQLDVLRAAASRSPGGDESTLPTAIEELTRWCGPQLLSMPRFTTEEVTVDGVTIPAGEPVVAMLGAANRDPRAFADPDRLDLRRPEAATHLAYAYGPHFCLGAALARVELQEAIGGLLRRFPSLALVEGGARRRPDPGTLRLDALLVTR